MVTGLAPDISEATLKNLACCFSDSSTEIPAVGRMIPIPPVSILDLSTLRPGTSQGGGDTSCLLYLYLSLASVFPPTSTRTTLWCNCDDEPHSTGRHCNGDLASRPRRHPVLHKVLRRVHPSCHRRFRARFLRSLRPLRMDARGLCLPRDNRVCIRSARFWTDRAGGRGQDRPASVRQDQLVPPALRYRVVHQARPGPAPQRSCVPHGTLDGALDVYAIRATPWTES